MKIYRKVVIDIETLEEIYEDSFEYSSLIAFCKGGGGGGGGSGQIDYPDYMETFHAEMLDDATADALSNSVVDHLNAAHGTNPFTGVTAYDPATVITEIDGELVSFKTILETLAEQDDWVAYLARAVDDEDGIVGKFVSYTPAAEGEIADDVAAYRAIIDDDLETKILPRFQRGMQDINAVQSSAFTIGQAILEAMAARDVAKYQGQLRVAAFTQADQINWEQAQLKNKMVLQAVSQMIQFLQMITSMRQTHLQSFMEKSRMEIIAEKEEAEVQMDLDESEALWDLEVWQYAGNILASIGGGVRGTIPGRASRTQSALAGAAAGAGAGMMMGGPWGAAIGGGIGLGMSLLS